jgi:hypothetical protein
MSQNNDEKASGYFLFSSIGTRIIYFRISFLQSVSTAVRIFGATFVAVPFSAPDASMPLVPVA